jgi:hypothetical protein
MRRERDDNRRKAAEVHRGWRSERREIRYAEFPDTL